MPFPNFVHLTNASPGAPRNSGTNGDLNALFRWAMPQVNIAQEFTGTNADVFRPATGNRFRFGIRHDDTVSGAAQRALFRGCESAASETSWTDPFPTVAQVADTSSNILVSSTANTTDRPFHLIACDTGWIFASDISSNGQWSVHWWFDMTENDEPDSFGTVVASRNNSGNSIVQPTVSNALSASSSNIFLARDITGTSKSSRGVIPWLSNTIGNVSTMPPLNVAPGGKLRRDQIFVSCSGSSTTTPSNNALPRRGAIPNLWAGLGSGNGGITSNDTFTDTAYDPAAVFILLPVTNTVNNVILEITNTWKPPV